MTSSFRENVTLHILGKSRRRWVDTRTPRTPNDSYYVTTEYLRIQVDAVAHFELVLDDANDGLLLGIFPVKIYQILSRLKLSKFMLRSNTSEQGSHMVPRGTEVYAAVSSAVYADSSSCSSSDDDDDNNKCNNELLDENLMKRSLAGLTCTPLSDMNNDYGNNEKKEFHGLLVTSGGMCTEEIQAHMNLLPGSSRSEGGDGLYYEAVSTIVSTNPGVLKRTSNRSIGISAVASPDCFTRSSSSERCSIRLELTTSYVVLVNVPTHNTGMEDNDNISLSLDQIFLGSHRARDVTGSISMFPFASSNFHIFCDPLSKTSRLYTMLPESRLFDCSDSDDPQSCDHHDHKPLIAGTNFKHLPPSNMSSINSIARFEHDLEKIGSFDMTQEWISFPLGIIENITFTEDFRHHSRGYVRNIAVKKGLVSRGSLQSITRNSSRKCEYWVKVQEIYPNFISPLLRTTKIYLHQGGGAGKIDYSHPTTDTIVSEIELKKSAVIFHFRNDDSAQIEVSYELPPDSSLWISMDFVPRFLNFQRFPADPNRGMDVPPALVTFFKSKCKDKHLSRFEYLDGLKATSKLLCPHTDCSVMLYSKPLLIMPPLPDTTMPFNVVCLSSTLFAFVIGLFLNILVKKSNESVRRRLYNEEPEKSKLQEYISAIKARAKSLMLSTKDIYHQPAAEILIRKKEL